MASTHGQQPATTYGSTRKDSTLAKKIDHALAAKLRQESEKTKDNAYPQSAHGSRPNRAKVYSVRLSDQEEDGIQKLAQSKHLPASTLVRSWILKRLELEQSSC